MPSFKYLIVGGGMTADSAVQGIREIDSSGSIGIISTESDPPYDRPPLTKGLWKDKSLDSIWRGAGKEQAQLFLGRTVKSFDPKQKQAADDQGAVYSFEKLLLATGGTPRLLPFGSDKIVYYRTVADYRRLRQLTEKAKRFIVIGGGFIGSEIAAALTMNGMQVTMLFPGPTIGNRIYPRELSEFLNRYYQEKGVTVAPGETATALEERGSEMVIRTKSGREFTADGVIAGLGIEPNTELARAAGLQVEDGIVVDAFLQTSAPDVFAAGDVAAFHNPALDRRLRVEHEDNANTMGKMAGRNMAGRRERYDHLPFFYSDLFDLGYEAVGELDSRLETVADWKTENREGAIYYLREDHVRGVLLWNTWGQVDAARELIAGRRTFRPSELKGLLPKAG
ncbi:MAG TPA: FAD/NAD(P)-binding oxidoreductase [Verrucomicrobiae bacterium]|jgi:NADPH-dependent 2,4-dienoyl-CoA reductase/sulfur reductase-like enzyme|nr:FAD/NAD(P)-binding oxidoreductase [Verrucomicrobiae bacterium]